MRGRAPEALQAEGIPLKADLAAAIRRGRNKPQFERLGDAAALLARAWRATRRTTLALFNLNQAMARAGRGLAHAIDRCQVDSIATCNAEIEADCWRFTLAGETAPDSRPWGDLLVSGDHKQIERAERTHYLDWKNPGLDGKPAKRVFKPKAGK